MFKHLLFVFSLYLGIVPLSVYAASWYSGTIRSIQVMESQELTVEVFSTSSHECGSKKLILNNPSSPGAEWIYQGLLEHHDNQRRIQFYIIRCDGINAVFNGIRDHTTTIFPDYDL